MSVMTASGVPDLKAMGMIPTFYADQVNIVYYAETMLPKITNSRFTGQVKQKGDKVIIPTRPVIEIKALQDGGNLEIQYPQSSNIELNVSRAAYFNVAINDIQEKQSQIMLSKEYITDAVERMKIYIETEFFADIYSSAHASNQGATAGVISGAYNLGTAASPVLATKSNVVELLMSIRQVLGEQNAPTENCWCVIPKWMAYALKISDLKNAMITGDKVSPLRSGLIGQIDGMDIYQSNLLYSSSGNYYIPAGNMDAIAFVAQLVKTETMRNPLAFGTLLRGEHVYDWKVIKPEGLATIVAKKGF